MRRQSINYLLLVGVGIIWGTSFNAIKLGVAEIGPATLAAGRIALAAILLWAWLTWVRKQRLSFSAIKLRHYLVVGILGNALPFTLIGISEITLSSALAAVLMGVMPIMTFALAALLLPDERFDRWRLAGVLFGFLGLLILLGQSVLDEFGEGVVAQLLALAAALSYAVTTVYVRRVTDTSGLHLATGAMLAVSVICVPVALIWENPLAGSFSLRSGLVIGYLGIMPTALASLIYFRLVKELGATTFSQVNYVVPLVGSVIGVVWMGEPFHWRSVAALLCILIGIGLVHYRRAPGRIAREMRDVKGSQEPG